ncbi:hypothetical protein F4802DRAFT_595189 [Xylaria palmicola]|nr:hypothetical protein F4802DRAFT_595189 [Xylaria palmicola]
MRVASPGAVALFLAGLVAANGGMISLRHHRIIHGGGVEDTHASLMKRGVQHQERYVAEPYNGPTYRCHDPHPEIFGPAPPVEDCDDVIKQFAALTTAINVKLVEGCYQIVSGNCTGLVCPQRLGESTIAGPLAAQYMASPLRDECIANGQRGWWADGQGQGVGIYLT